jgi:hypothetical protein
VLGPILAKRTPHGQATASPARPAPPRRPE